MRGARAAALALGALLAGCSVVPLPRVAALRGQTDRDRQWDARECAVETSRRTGYNPADSPGANFLQDVFFWGTAGAAVGGLVTGLPASVSSTATEGLIAGSGAGGLTGGIRSWSGQRRFERAWVQCMEARGYAPAPDGADTAGGQGDGSGPAAGRDRMTAGSPAQEARAP